MNKIFIFFTCFLLLVVVLSAIAKDRRFEALFSVASRPIVATASTDSYTVFASNYIALWYRFSSFTNSSGQFIDYSGNSRIGSNYNAKFRWVNTPPHVVAAGSNAVIVNANNVYEFNGVTAMCVSCWVYQTNGWGVSDAFLFQGDDTVHMFREGVYTVTSNMAYQAGGASARIYYPIFSTNAYGTWRYVVHQWWPSNIVLYVDGYKAGQLLNSIFVMTNWSFRYVSSTYQGRMLWGNEESVGGRYWWGGLDELIIRTNYIASTNDVTQEWLSARGIYGR